MAKLGMWSKITTNSVRTLQKPLRELRKVILQSVQVYTYLYNHYICISLKISNHISKS